MQSKLFHVAICDDDASIHNLLYKYFDEFSENNNCHFEITSFIHGKDLLHTSSLKEFDLLFLDIELDGINGIAISHLLRSRLETEDLPIVFITAYETYMKEMFDVRPFQHLSKPFSRESFFHTLNDFLKISMRKSKFFTFKNAQEWYRISFSEIIFFESHLRKIAIHTISKDYEFYEKLSILERELSGLGFYRIHQSYIINPVFIISFNAQYVTLKGGVRIPITSKYRESFIRMQLDM